MLSVNTIVVGSFARTWMVEEALSLLESQHGDRLSKSLRVSLLLRMPSPADVSMELQLSSTEIPIEIEEYYSSI